MAQLEFARNISGELHEATSLTLPGKDVVYGGRPGPDLTPRTFTEATSLERIMAIKDPIKRKKTAEDLVRVYKGKRIADLSDEDSAIGFASMDVTDALYQFDPDFHSKYYTIEEAQRISDVIDLVLKARQKISPSTVGHLGRPQDIWADERIAAIQRRKIAQELRVVVFSRKNS